MGYNAHKVDPVTKPITSQQGVPITPSNFILDSEFVSAKF